MEGPSGEIARLIYPQAGDLTILKPRHSAFYASPLELLLAEMQTRELVICGIATDMCVQLTVPTNIIPSVIAIAGWNWILDLLAYRFRAVRRLLEAKPLELVREGKLMRRNLRREHITPEEIMAKLREHGIDKLEAVKVATMESDGEITVIQNKGQTGEGPSRTKGMPPA